MLTIREVDRGKPIYDQVIWALDPHNNRPYVSIDHPVRIIGPFALVWNVAEWRKKPLVWSDIERALPFRLITYPAIRWIGNRLNTSPNQG